MKTGDKLYVITRQDLSPGQQAVQAAHALVEFIVDHPDLARAWRTASNYLALLAVRSEAELLELHGRAREARIPAAVFHEPDRDDELTALVLAPRGKALCRKLPLALADPLIGAHQHGPEEVALEAREQV